VIKDFCGSASEDGVRRNLLLLEEIMAEVINHGHIYTTELSSLRPCVYSEAAEIAHPRNASMLSSLASQEQKGLMPNAASVRPVFAPRSDRQQHRQRGDIFVDVIEKLFATISKEGKLLNFQLDGTVNLRSCLESQVDVTLGLNENLVLADSALQAASYSTDVVLSSYIIHDSVNMDSFSEHRTLVVRSPQGEVPVLRYQTTDLPHNGLPFTITTAVEEVSNSRDLELTVRLRCEGNPASEAVDTTVQIPVPSNTTGLMKRFNELEQTVEFQRESRKLVWRIKRLQANQDDSCTRYLTNANEGGSSKLQLGPMALKFELSNQSSSGLKIRFLRLSRATDAQRW
ncbi:clathrin coat assembly protein, putative, partial [Ixodes scapularis]